MFGSARPLTQTLLGAYVQCFFSSGDKRQAVGNQPVGNPVLDSSGACFDHRDGVETRSADEQRLAVFGHRHARRYHASEGCESWFGSQLDGFEWASHDLASKS